MGLWRSGRSFNVEPFLPAASFCLALLVYGRWLGTYELGPDEGFNFGKAALLLKGIGPYGDLWNDQPPVVTYLLAGLQLLAPESVAAGRFLILLFAGAILYCLFRLVRQDAGRTAAYCAVLLLVSSAPFVNLSVAVLIGLPAISLAMLAILVASQGPSLWLARSLIAGALFGLSLQAKFFTFLIAPAFLVALYIHVDAGYRTRALAASVVAAWVVWFGIALISGQPVLAQIIEPHVAPALRNSYSFVRTAFQLAKFLFHSPAIAVAGGIGLCVLLATRRIYPVPLIWAAVAISGLLLHNPVWFHQFLLVLIPLAWIGGVAIRVAIGDFGAAKWPALGRSYRFAPHFALGLVFVLALVQASQPEPGGRRSQSGYAGAETVARFSGLGDWVLTDSPLDAFRAGKLLVPEFAVYSAKRVRIGKATPDDVIAAIEKRKPAQVMYRRFQIPPEVESYLEANYLRTYALNKQAHFVSREAKSPDVSPEKAFEAFKRVAADFESRAIRGGYAGVYDLGSNRRYERPMDDEPLPENTIVIRPPGSTEGVGACFLRAADATGDPFYLEAARRAAKALACAQTERGGWNATATLSADCPAITKHEEAFDEGTPAAILRFLLAMREKVSIPADGDVLERAIRRGLDFLVESQDEYGAWPLAYWSEDYTRLPTLNDRVTTSAIGILLRGYAVYGDPRYLESARRGGDFLIAAQGPRRQPAWASQYDSALKPAAARTFEPASYSSRETGVAMLALIDLFAATGDEKYLEPLPAARNWLLRSRIAPERWARFYEIGTNRPIYGDRDGRVYYRLSEISRERQLGYDWEERFPEVITALRLSGAVLDGGREALETERKRNNLEAGLEKTSHALLAIDGILSDAEDGRWDDGSGRILTADFIKNCRTVFDAFGK